MISGEIRRENILIARGKHCYKKNSQNIYWGRHEGFKYIQLFNLFHKKIRNRQKGARAQKFKKKPELFVPLKNSLQ